MSERVVASLSSHRESIFALVIILLAGLTCAACKSGYPVSARNSSNIEARRVRTAQVTEKPMERTVTVTGTLFAYDQATVSAKVPGRVQRIVVDLGSTVRKGQLIAQLEPQDYQLRLKQAEAGLAQARARIGLSPEGGDEHIDPENTASVRQARALLDDAKLRRDRAQSLFQNGVIPKAQLDGADAEYKVAVSRYQDAVEEIRNRQALVVQRRSELEIARQQLVDLSIYAPFDAVVQQKRTSIGEYLAAGTPVVDIVRTDPLRLRAEVPERESNRVRAGQEVRVNVEGDSNIYSGKIARLSPSIAAQSRILVVEAEVRNNGQLRPGSFVRGDVIIDESNLAPAVPTDAIVSFAGIDKVISVKDGKAVEKAITLGRHYGDWTEVLSGVEVGEVIVLNPGNLQSGQPVIVEDES